MSLESEAFAFEAEVEMVAEILLRNGEVGGKLEALEKAIAIVKRNRRLRRSSRKEMTL